MSVLDIRQLTDLANDLTSAGPRATAGVRASVQQSAARVKESWRTNAIASSGSHARAYPYSITYETRFEPTGASGVIGPDKAKPQGALGNLLEYGSAKNPPHDDGGRALRAEEENLERALADMVEKATLP